MTKSQGIFQLFERIAGENRSMTTKSKEEILNQIDELFAESSSSGTLPILTDYPTTDATKSGQEFIYKGNQWSYMTEDEIDSVGWNGLVSIGFPSPVNKVFNPSLAFGSFTITSNGVLPKGEASLDFLGLSNPVNMKVFNCGLISNTIFSDIKNAHLLKSLEDQGTRNSIFLIDYGLTESIIDSLFTQLPSTTKTATINVSANPGSATCDPSIATNKGYTVIT